MRKSSSKLLLSRLENHGRKQKITVFLGVEMHYAFLLAALAAGIVAAPVSAKGAPRDIMCNAIMKTPEGKFTYNQIPGLSIVDAVRQPGPFDAKGPPEMVGFSCLRTSVVPIVDDIKVLQAGYSLHIGGGRRGLSIFELKLKDGRVVFESSGSSLSAKDQKAVNAVLQQMQERIAAPGS